MIASAFVKGDICDAELVDELVADHRLVVHFAAESHNDNSLRDPIAVPADEPDRHVHAARSGPQARRADPSRVDRRGLRRPRAGRPGSASASPRRTTRRARTRRPRRARTCSCAAWVRSFGVEATISNCSNNYGPYQHVEKFIPRQITNVLDGGAAQAVRRRGERARLDPRRRPQLGGADDHRARAVPARRTSSAPTASRTTSRSSRRSSSCSASPPTPTTTSPTGRATTSATRSTPRSCAPSSAGSRGTSRSATGLRQTIDWYRDNESWWRPQKDATEAKYAAQGQ